MKKIKILLFVSIFFMLFGCAGDPNVKADAKKEADIMEYMYMNYYKKYSPVDCAKLEYKGYLFLRCYKVGDKSQGGIYVVDDTKKNNVDSFTKYAVNGTAKSQLDTIFKNAGKRYEDIKELPLPLPSWLDIGEINELFKTSKKYKNEYVKEGLF